MKPVRPENLTYGVDDVPPFGKLLLLGLQQVLLIAIYLVMVVIMVHAAHAPEAEARSAMSLAMVALGAGAALQALRRVGSGYLAPPVLSAVYLHPTLLAVALGGLPLAFGMTIAAGLLEMALSRLLRFLKTVFPTLVCGFIVLAVGVELGLVGARELLDVGGRAAGKVGLHVAVASVTLATMIGLAIWGRGIVRLLCSMLGLLAGCALAGIVGFIAPQAIQAVRHAPLFGLPRLGHLSYSLAPAVAVPFAIASVAAALRTIGVITTCQRINDANWKRPEARSIAGGVLADGLGCALGGLLGAPGMASAPSSVGVSQATGATSRVIAFAIAGWFFLFALMPKLAACFLAMPETVVGAGLMFTGSLMIVSGVQIIAARPLDTRKTMVVGISLLLGLSHEAFPQFYQALPAGLRYVTDSMLSIATLSAVALNFLFRIGIRQSSTMDLQLDDASMEQFGHLLQQKAKSWGVTGGVVEEATATARRCLHLIEDGHLADGPVHARVSFDDVSFAVDIRYRGDLLRLPVRRAPSEEDMLEEAPMASGLSGFLAGVHPDRLRAATHDGECRVEVGFDL